MSTTIQTILVTGGYGSFGRLIVETLARQGAHVGKLTEGWTDFARKGGNLI